MANNFTSRLQARGLRLAYGRAPIIDGLELAFPDGQVIAIVGPNGCGKSTLLAGRDIQQLPSREVAYRVALLLDEPTSALDLGHLLEVFELIRSLIAAGKTVVMVVHDLVSACRYADHLVAMLTGRIRRPRQAERRRHARSGVPPLHGVDCTLILDPATGSPIPTRIRCAV